jgi:hypothetical protein
MTTIRSKKPQLDFIVGQGLYDSISFAAKRLGCSKAEIIRTALYQYLQNIVGNTMLTEKVIQDVKPK